MCILHKVGLQHSFLANPLGQATYTVFFVVPALLTLIFMQLFKARSSNFLSEDHISYCTAVQGPDILRNVMVSGYVAFYQINNFC